MKLLITFAFAANLVAPAAGTGLRSLWSSSLGEQQDGRDLQGTFFECGNVTRSFCHTASQDCVDDACVCKPGMVSDGRVCVDLDECATDFPCVGTDLVDVFCEDRDPDNFFYKCNCMPGFATVLPVPDGEITIGTVTIPSIGGVPISFRPLSCVFIPVPEPAPTPAPVETIQLINGTNVTVTPAPTNPPTMPGPQCTRKCNEGKESCLDDGNPNADGLFKCTCVGGFTRAPNGDACIPGDGCVDNICGVGALCVQLSEDSGGHTCVCPTGTVGGAFTACVDPALLSSNITIRYPLIFQQEVNVTQVIAILNAAMNSLVNETVAGSGGEIVAGVESAGVEPIENLAAGGAIVVEAIRVICPLGSAAGAFCLNITQVIPVQSADATPAMGIQAELEGRIEVLIDNDRFDDILRNQTFVGVNGNPVTVIVIEPEDLPTAAPNVRNLRNFEMDDEDYYDHVDKTCDCVFCDEDEQCGQLWFGDEIAKPQQFTKMHIVISHCEHDLGWLEEKKLNDMNLEVDVTVISKCGKPVLGAPHGSKIITLPNTGRNDHTYAYYIVNELKASEGDDAVVIFTKDNIGANNIHQVGNWRSFQKMVQVAWNRGFACGIESSNLPVGDTEYSVSTYHDMKYLGEFSLEKYTRNSGAVNSDFQSSSYQDINDFIHQTLAPAQLPERVMPVCYGGLFAASTKNIFAQPEEVWTSVERSLTRGNNILEGHFVERLWAGLLSTPLTASQTAALVAYSDHVYHAGDSIDGALIHEPTIYEAVSIEANSLDTIHGSIVENNKQVDNDKPKLYLLVGPTKQGCELAKSNEALMKDNLYYVGTNLEECLGHDIERPTLSKQAAADMMDGCFTAFGKNSKNCGNHWAEFKNTLEYYSVRDHNVIVALEALGGVEFMTESHRERMLELEELWNVVPVVTYQHFHEFVPAMFSVQQDSWNKKDQTTTIADSFSHDFGYQVSTAMPNVNKLNPLSVYVTFTGLFEKTLPVMDLNSAIDSTTAFACDILKAKSTCQSLSASASSSSIDDNLVIADALAVAAHEQGLVHKDSCRRAVRQEIFTLLTEERELDVPEKCMSPVQLKELYRVSAKMNQAMPGVESIVNTDQDHKVCSVDAVQMLKDNAAAFHGVFMAHATAATVAQE